MIRPGSKVHYKSSQFGEPPLPTKYADNKATYGKATLLHLNYPLYCSGDSIVTEFSCLFTTHFLLVVFLFSLLYLPHFTLTTAD